jgi:hypothetical protein
MSAPCLIDDPILNPNIKMLTIENTSREEVERAIEQPQVNLTITLSGPEEWDIRQMEKDLFTFIWSEDNDPDMVKKFRDKWKSTHINLICDNATRYYVKEIIKDVALYRSVAIAQEERAHKLKEQFSIEWSLPE